MLYTLKKGDTVVAEQDEPITYDPAFSLWYTNGVILGDPDRLLTLTVLPPVPESVSPRQIRQALTAVSLRDPVEGAISAASKDTQDWYAFATAFERSHPMVAALATGLGVTVRQLDDLWTLAATL